jgi:enamine deaminase RidA (YjgF/YER057c/UK114 family)
MHINPPELLAYPGLTQVVVTQGKKTVYIAGQVSCDKQYNVLGEGDYFVQFCNVLKNVKVAAEAAGATVDHVVSSIVYVKDINPEVLKALTNAWAVALDGAPFPPAAVERSPCMWRNRATSASERAWTWLCWRTSSSARWKPNVSACQITC